jgi:hypothetical protein
LLITNFSLKDFGIEKDELKLTNTGHQIGAREKVDSIHQRLFYKLNVPNKQTRLPKSKNLQLQLLLLCVYTSYLPQSLFCTIH